VERRGSASQEAVRRHNLGGLLSLLHVQGATSRSDLGSRTGLNRSTVGVLTSQLAQVGLLRECAPVGSGTAGRPSIVVEPCRTTYALAVEVGVECLTAARVGLGGIVLQRRELPSGAQDHDPARTVARVLVLLEELLEDTGPEEVCVGLGVAVCGLVRPDDGTVRLAPNLEWVDVPLGDLLAERLHPQLPVRIGNEADLGARAEHLRGAGAGATDMVYLSGQVGVGGGIILGGRPLTGAGGYAGELGHMVVNPTGRRCRCGRSGCWETEIGEDAVLRATGSGPGRSLAEVFAAQRAGDADVQAGLREIGRWLGSGLANIVNLFNPELILFGGLAADLFRVLEPEVRASLDGTLHAPRAQVRLELPGLGTDSNLVGAAELAFAPLLNDPLAVLAAARGRSGGPLGRRAAPALSASSSG